MQNIIGKAFTVLLLWIGASVALVSAKYIAANWGLELGAIPTVLIVSPFLYLIVKVIVRPKTSDPLPNDQIEKLEAIASNPKLSDTTRAEAQSRAAALRSAAVVEQAGAGNQ